MDDLRLLKLYNNDIINKCNEKIESIKLDIKNTILESLLTILVLTVFIIIAMIFIINCNNKVIKYIGLFINIFGLLNIYKSIIQYFRFNIKHIILLKRLRNIHENLINTINNLEKENNEDIAEIVLKISNTINRSKELLLLDL